MIHWRRIVVFSINFHHLLWLLFISKGDNAYILQWQKLCCCFPPSESAFKDNFFKICTMAASIQLYLFIPFCWRWPHSRSWQHQKRETKYAASSWQNIFLLPNRLHTKQDKINWITQRGCPCLIIHKLQTISTIYHWFMSEYQMTAWLNSCLQD